jgi:ABC-2 type transport system permease protein
MFPFVFFSVALIANIATASFIVLIYTGLLKILRYHRFKDVLAYIQIGLTFVIFFSYQLIPRMGQRFIQEGTDVTGKWLFAAPSAWFAGAVQVLLGMGRKGDASLAGIAVFATVFLLLFAFRRISLQYAGLVAQVHTVPERPRKDRTGTHLSKGQRDSVLARLAGWVFSSSEFLAGFQLISTMLKRDRMVKMGIYPILGFPLAFLLLAVLQRDFKDPFVEGSITGGGSFSSMFVFFIFFMIYQSLMTLVTSREWDAAWIFIAAPIVSPGRFYLGAMMSVLVRLVIPFFMLLGVISCTQIPVVHAIKHTISLFLYGLVAFSVGTFLLKEYPFSRKRERGERMQRFSFLLFVAPFFIVTYTLQIVTTRSTLLWWTTQGALLILFFILESLGLKRLDRVLKTKEFFV